MSRLVLAVVLAAAACGGSGDEPTGLGKWRFGTTVLGDITEGLCQPTDLNDGRKGSWCFAQPAIRVGDSVGEIHLYFLGGGKTAPLIEIQVRVRGCREQELDQWMRQGFGSPIESRSTRGYWKNAYLWAAALMPSEPGRCVVHFVPLSENAEIARIKQL